MGTFAGHALPGSFFIFFALWAIYFILKRFYRRRAYVLHLSPNEVEEYKSRVSFPISCSRSGYCRKIPIDSFAKAITCAIGLTGEIYTGFNAEWKFVHIGNVQHTTMFATFGLSGIVELLIFYGIMKTSLQVEYIFSFIALLAEAFLFAFHLHGRTPIDIYVHMLLLGVILVSIAFGFCEALNPHEPIYALVRSWGFLMQGTWFWQVGAILYPVASWMPRWDELAKESFPRAANLFCYHLLITFVAIVVIASAMSLRLGRVTGSSMCKSRDFTVSSNAGVGAPEYEMEETTLYVAPSRREVVTQVE